MTTQSANAGALGAGRLERLLRLRHQHPRQHAGADRPAALRAEDARRAWSSAASCPALGLMMFLSHRLLRLARLPARQAHRPQRRLRAALGHQRAAHVRRHVRDHAADPSSRPAIPIKGWEAGLAWVFIQSFVLMIGGFIAPVHPQDHAARRAARHAGRRVDHLHLDAPGAGDVHDAGDRHRLLRHHPGSWFGGVRYPRGIPAGLVAIAVGMLIAWGSTALGLDTAA